jgi:hypothetical protein
MLTSMCKIPWNRSKNLLSHTPCDLPIFNFMITFASYFTIGKALGWRTFPKCAAGLGYIFIIGLWDMHLWLSPGLILFVCLLVGSSSIVNCTRFHLHDVENPLSFRGTKQTKWEILHRALLAIVTRHHAPTTTTTNWPPRGSYLSSFVESRLLALEAFVVNCDCFLDWECSIWTFVRAWIWNSFKYRAFLVFVLQSSRLWMQQNHNKARFTS